MMNDDERKTLVAKRGKIKAKLTRFCSYFEKVTQETNLEEVKCRLSNIQPCLEEYADIQDQLELLDTTTDYSNDMEDFETQYFGIVGRCKTYVQAHEGKEPQNKGNDNATTRTPTPSHCDTPSVRLPTVSLPTFSGKFNEWMPFIDSFNSLIDNNDQLNDVHKLQYLKGALKLEAAEVLQNLEIVSTNYKIALDLLKKQYHNERLIIQKHIKSLFDLPTVQRDNPTRLRDLVTKTLTHMRALQALKINTDNWDPMIIHLVTSRLDHMTHREWELTTQPDKMPSLNDLTEYLLKRSQTLDSVSNTHDRYQTVKDNNTTHARFQTPKDSKGNFSHRNNARDFPNESKSKCHVLQNSKTGGCALCGGKHNVYNCNELRKGTYNEKFAKLTRAKLCSNCLTHGHTVSNCRSSGCRICFAKHHTSTHVTVPTGQQPHTGDANRGETAGAGTSNFLSSTTTLARVLLNTAVVQVTGPTGRTAEYRALLDNGSECSYMTEAVAQQLGLQRTPHNIEVTGLNQTRQRVGSMTEATVSSLVANYKTNMSFLIIPKITGQIPSESLNLSGFKVPKHTTLADPTFNVPGKIDLLIGQEIFWDIICVGQIKQPRMPTLQKTRLGWVVGGKIDGIPSNNSQQTCLLSSIEAIDSTMQKFWILEEPKQTKQLTATERVCEEHYEENTRRGIDGRYTVKMPLRSDPRELGDSKEIATRRFKNLEQRLQRQPDLKRMYTDFMNEYINLNHMEEVNESLESHDQPEYFLPHHPILKESSTTTKLRVVFDASAKTTSGKSLNDIQLVGPVVQDNLFSVILRFRTHTYAITADIEKMYRQIQIDESQRNLLKIIWRNEPSEPLKTYKMSTVTYGTASAPYLATRTLNKLADDESGKFPTAAAVIKRDFYVDDMLTGCNTLEEAVTLQNQLMSLLSTGGLNLRKWNSNSPEVLRNVPENMRERQPQQFAIDASIKTLGLWWNAETDEFQFKYTPSERKRQMGLSKRIILAEIAKLFDPLGLVAPVIVRAKLLMQELWSMKVDWDETLPMHIHTQWKQLQDCLRDVSKINISRQVTHATGCVTQLHGFADASQRAYGGAVYMKQKTNDGTTKVALLCSKSRVAPLKTISLPRLELCAALLLVELMETVKEDLHLQESNVIYWTDSTVTLDWIRGEPARWTTFVANRVAKIQGATISDSWRHVDTGDNPADLLSRGTNARKLEASRLWWNGPRWLQEDEESWPTQTIRCAEDIPEMRPRKIGAFLTTTATSNDTIEGLIGRVSSFNKLIRVLTYCKRFIKNLATKTSSERQTGPLTTNELTTAKKLIFLYLQEKEFPDELKLLKQSKTCPRNSKLLSLSPFCDKYGIIRVGGRIQEAPLPYDTIHPILLPKNNKVTLMIAEGEHIRLLHCGPQALLYALRQEYWPINGRDLVRRVTHQCVKCFRARPREASQLMGSLPASRVTPARPFFITGVDYCGPFNVKQSRRRNAPSTKAYVAVFVCLATKAVHIELVSDLTTEAFLSALRRFVARRGIPTEVHSDNGSNFVGAKNEIRRLRTFFKEERKHISSAALNHGINWKFIPPSSPHMGGIWEAAVKSLKRHLRRTIGLSTLTFEELGTVLIQVEAVMNSRPLTPLSNDPSDLSALTPGHFLTGGSLVALPEPSLTHLPEQRLSRWQHTQRLIQHFWARWSSEYLTSLQQRKKWKTATTTPIQVGALVLLKEDNLPPLAWRMGRVTQLYPGKDQLTRVAAVKTSSGETKRSIVKLCPLPVEPSAPV